MQKNCNRWDVGEVVAGKINTYTLFWSPYGNYFIIIFDVQLLLYGKKKLYGMFTKEHHGRIQYCTVL